MEFQISGQLVEHSYEYECHMHTHTHSPPLPSNIKQLGDPDSVPKIMPLKVETETEPVVKPVERPTVDPHRLAKIWNKYFVNTP